jgi:2-polyprenyl-6-methoxyphenol hydroxylase-like FAD-dependent oxidoreductase
LFEAAPVFREIGGGINLGPHAIKVFAELGLQPALEAAGILPLDYAFFTRFGQLVYREPWGRAAGHEWPHISIHRADLQAVLAAAVQERLGADRVAMGHRCVGFSETGSGVVAHFADGRADAGAIGARRGGAAVSWHQSVARGGGACADPDRAQPGADWRDAQHADHLSDPRRGR